MTIPKSIRDRFGLGPNSEVEFEVVRGAIVLRKRPQKLALKTWRRQCGESLSELGYRQVDEYIRDVRGR